MQLTPRGQADKCVTVRYVTVVILAGNGIFWGGGSKITMKVCKGQSLLYAQVMGPDVLCVSSLTQ